MKKKKWKETNTAKSIENKKEINKQVKAKEMPGYKNKRKEELMKDKLGNIRTA